MKLSTYNIYYNLLLRVISSLMSFIGKQNNETTDLAVAEYYNDFLFIKIVPKPDSS
jgi:hypothetical protein